mmetsp:Transcript_30386/g.43528  ORF Transcript_30386/g.43528 Transcript_30386/m.43528 type:complete len:276 (-) Transcript_30386:146-973(-)
MACISKWVLWRKAWRSLFPPCVSQVILQGLSVLLLVQVLDLLDLGPHPARVHEAQHLPGRLLSLPVHFHRQVVQSLQGLPALLPGLLQCRAGLSGAGLFRQQGPEAFPRHPLLGPGLQLRLDGLPAAGEQVQVRRRSQVLQQPLLAQLPVRRHREPLLCAPRPFQRVLLHVPRPQREQQVSLECVAVPRVRLRVQRGSEGGLEAVLPEPLQGPGQLKVAGGALQPAGQPVLQALLHEEPLLLQVQVHGVQQGLAQCRERAAPGGWRPPGSSRPWP